MIGGCDYIFEVPRVYPGWHQEQALRYLGQWWPAGMVVVDELPMPIALRVSFAVRQVRLAKDVFIHSSLESVRTWDELGAVPENENTMIYLIFNEGFSISTSRVTAVIDRRTEQMNHLLESLRQELQSESIWWTGPPYLEAA